MKSVKKILSSFISAATIMSTVTSLGFTASAYDICDVNHDGSVSISDVAALSRYLSGNLRVPDYNILDVNKSLTVDYMDEQRVLAKVMGYSYSSVYYSKKNNTTSNAPTGVKFNALADNVVTSSREYRRYSYTNKKELASYKLQPSTALLTSASSNVSERAIIGPTDDRYMTTGSENIGIVYLNINNSGNGTGFIVGDHQIATVAHNVYDGDWFSTMEITSYNYNGELSNTKFTAVEAHFPKNYNPDVKNSKYDYALITVKEDLSKYIQFNLGTSYSVNQSNFSRIPIYVTGHPRTTPAGYANVTNRLYTAEGRVIDKSIDSQNAFTNNSVIYYNTDTDYGNSGSPVYTVTKNMIDNKSTYTYTVLAVHHGGKSTYANYGSMMTKYQLQFYNSNPYTHY